MMKTLLLALALLALPCLVSAATGTIVLSTNPVTQAIAGPGIKISPSSGKGVVTISTNGATSDGEVPSGTIDSDNRVFTLAHAPAPNTPQNVKVFSDGIRINPANYTVSGVTLTFNPGSVNTPSGDLVVDYAY